MTQDSDSFNSDKYEILRPLDHGGVGKVYLARDKRLARLVAIKILREDLPNSDGHGRLQRIAQQLAQLNHPNIVRIYDIFEQEQSIALVMEYVDGCNLQSKLEEHTGNLEQSLRWLTQISEALAASHELGIAHGDLRAENVLIGSDGVAKVCDFGVAGTGVNFPEDLLALGVLAARMLEAEKDIPPAVSHLLEQLTSSQPARRPSSRDAASDFRELLLATTPDIVRLQAEPAPRPASPAPYIAFGLVAVLAMALAGYIFREPAQRQYVAILPTTFTDGSGLTVQQRYNLQVMVQQALQESVIDTGELVLIGARETAGVQGGPSVLASALGADSLVTSMLDCNSTACDLTIERLAGPHVVPTQRRRVTLLVDSSLQSHDAIQLQWRYLFPESTPLHGASELISEQDYRLYIELYQRDRQARVSVEDSLSQLEQLLGRADSFMPLYRLYTEVALEGYEFTGDFALLDRLEEMLIQARARSANSLLMHQSWFELASARGDYTAAAATLDQIRSSGGDDLLITELSALLYLEMSDYERAEEYFARAIALRPSMRLLYGRARNLYFWAKLQRSLEILDELLELYPYSTRAHALKGAIFLERGELELAIKVYEKGLAIRPDPIQRSNLGLAYMLQGDYAQARTQFITAYENDSRDHSVLLNLADTESLLGDEARARDLYQTLIARSLKGAHGTNLNVLAQAYAQLGQFQDAIATLELMEAGPDVSLDYSFTAALVYSLSGQKILALTEIDSALASGINNVWFNLPWFDPLCTEPRFSAILQESEPSGRCPGGM